MSEERLDELLSAWQEQQRQGRDVPAAELCHEHPDLQPELERRIEALRQLDGLAGQVAETLQPPAPPCEGATQVAGLRAAPAGNGLCVPGYDILGTLGRGGMGVVYQARQTKLGRLVALKMILSGAHAGEADLARFRTEAEAIARLQHPNIVQIYEVGEQGGLPFFSLEFCAGGSLEKKLAGTPLPPMQAAMLVETLARAMQVAHDKGVIHRDLKPANVLLAEDGTPKVTDFGLAKKLDEAGQTATGAVMGTPGYMAPEQAGGKSAEVGPLADVYALGAILYECLTGRPPFRAATPLDTLLQMLENQPAPPRLLNPKVDRDLETICLKCLEKASQCRYASAEALAADLGRYLAGDPVHARNINLMSRIALVLDRSQYDVQFGAYANMLFGFAAIVLLTEVAVTWIIHARQPPALLALTQATGVLLIGLVFWWHRPTELVPASAAGRIMWSVWVGYMVACFVLASTYRLVVGQVAVELELNLYPGLAAVTGMAFFVLGSSYWGRCFAFGLAFYGLAFLMTLNLGLAPVEFGILWAVVLTTIGRRLRGLGDNGKKQGKVGEDDSTADAPFRVPERGRPGRGSHALRIAGYNRTLYAAAAFAILVGMVVVCWPTAPLLLRWIAGLAVAVACWFACASFWAFHWMFDRSELLCGRWLIEEFPQAPARWVQINAGLEETTVPVGAVFPDTLGTTLVRYDPTVMTEPAITRARRRQKATAPALAAQPEALPVEDGGSDLVLVMLAAHEIRTGQKRERFFKELHRIAAPRGKVIVVEHLRDLPALLAFGPGVFHFFPRDEWLRLGSLAGLELERERRITPFVRVFVYRRHEAARSAQA
jgi:serine/threonine-protein kinase